MPVNMRMCIDETTVDFRTMHWGNCTKSKKSWLGKQQILQSLLWPSAGVTTLKAVKTFQMITKPVEQPPFAFFVQAVISAREIVVVFLI